MGEYKDKQVKDPFIPLSLKKHNKKLSLVLIVASLLLLFGTLSRYDLLDLGSSPYNDDEELGAKMVKFKSNYKDNDVDYNAKVNHIDLSKVGKKPHGINHPEKQKGAGIPNRNDKNGFSKEDDIDTTIDAKVVGSISKGSKIQDDDATLKKLRDSGAVKGDAVDDTRRPFNKEITTYDKKKEAIEDAKPINPHPAAHIQQETNPTPVFGSKKATKTSTLTKVVPTAPLGGNKNNYDEKNVLKPLPVIAPLKEDGKPQILALQQENINGKENAVIEEVEEEAK